MQSFSKTIRSIGNKSVELQTTSLNTYHKTVLKAKKMGSFCGYDMPIFYDGWGIMKEHIACREYAAVFDVSHMGQVKIYGNDREEFVNKIFVADTAHQPVNEAKLSLILNENGGIIDDAIITKMSDHYHIVLNAGNKNGDVAHMNQLLHSQFTGRDLRIESFFDTKSLVAFQGPRAALILQKYMPQGVDLKKLAFLGTLVTNIPELDGEVLHITRCGYTGEDGFEISVSNEKVERLCDLLFEDPKVAPAGLGARDSLRLEAGLCLHGNDIGPDVTPVEAGLMWTVRKKGDIKFIGQEAIEKVKAEKSFSHRRVGFIMETEKGIPRPGVEVLNEESEIIGKVCSGGFSPILKRGLGMAYLKVGNTKVGIFPLY